MNYSDILVETADRVTTVTLNRPAKLNAWTHTMEEELRHGLLSAAGNPDVRAIVITGQGRGFCAGADMELIAGVASGNAAADGDEALNSTPAAEGIEANYAHRFSYMLTIPKPIIAAINGPIAGIGLCMAVFCDFRYMASGTRMTTAFARRGLIAEHGISWMLPRLIGPMNAMDLLFSARAVPAEEAAQLGLVKLLDADGFLASVQAGAKHLVHNASPRSIGVIKRQVYDSLFQSLTEAWQQADGEMAKSFASEDFQEGVAHFLEKREPQFTGR